MEPPVRSVLPPLTVVLVILAVWVAAVVPMNMHLTADQAVRQDIVVTPDTPADRKELSGLSLALKNPTIWGMTYTLERPRLPSPHQVGAELWDTVVMKSPTSRRSLVYHAWGTLSATMLGLSLIPIRRCGRTYACRC